MSASRTAIVTGAASGIGRAIAQRLARDGFAVTVADNRHEPITGGEPTDALIREAGGEAVYRRTELGDPEACERLIADVVAERGRLDVVVNNAAVAGRYSKALVDTMIHDWDVLMAVNVRAPFVLCRDAVRQMLRQEPDEGVRGRIVNVTSQHGMVGVPGHFAYAVSKGALVQMTRQVAVEHGRDGILCNAVAPGKIGTGTMGDFSQDEKMLAYTWSRTPFSRLGRPDDVAGAVAFLASPDATYVSGVNLLVDGGWMAY